MPAGRPAPDAVTSVVVCSDYGHVAGGAERVAIGSALGIAHTGRQVHFFAAIGPVDEHLHADSRITVHCLGQTKVGDARSPVRATLRTLRNASAADRLGTVLDTLDPARSVVHFHSYAGGLGASPLLRARDQGFTTILTAHDYGLACPQQSLYDHSLADRCLLQPLSLACCTRPCTSRGVAFKGAVTLRALVHRHDGVAGAVHGFVVPSDFAYEVLAPHLPARPVEVVANPIEVEDCGPADPHDPAPFAFVGRMTPEKDPATFLLACRIASVPALVIGDGTELAVLRTAFPEATFVPWSPCDEVNRLIRTARAVVIPSRWLEVGPLVAHEAAANGIPIVAADANAAASVVEQLGGGMTFRTGDAHDLARVLTALSTRETALELGHRAHVNYWRDPSTPAVHVSRILEFYAKLLRSRGG